MFEWDEEKNKINVAKHKISFEQAREAFNDPFRLVAYDDVNSLEDEDRSIIIGANKKNIVLFVVCTDRKGITRIISARKADKNERRMYYERIRRIYR